MKSKNDVFFDIFAGEFVEIVQDFEITSSFQIVDDQTQEVRMPMTVSGFLMDMDDTYVYLSPDSENVTQALPKSSIKHIGIVDIKDEAQEILDDIPSPDTDRGFN